MPFCSDPYSAPVPDMLVNPCALPSRMTIAQLIECLMGLRVASTDKKRYEYVKAIQDSVKDGMITEEEAREMLDDPEGDREGSYIDYGDATPFKRIDVEDIKNELEKMGYNSGGNFTMYCGKTGEKMEALIFTGPTYYQRLKHMVYDKIHCLTMDHEVLTIEGWKLFHDLTLQDKICCLREDKIVYENPTELHYYPNKKDLFHHIRGEEIDLCVTSGHRLYISKYDVIEKKWGNGELIKAKDLTGTDFPIKFRSKGGWIETKHVYSIDVIHQIHDVFCVSVPSEVFYVRRNKKEVWTGNSRGTGQNQILCRQPMEGRKLQGGLKCGSKSFKTVSSSYLTAA